VDVSDFELSVQVIEEAGYASAIVGLSFNKDQDPNNMHEVAKYLAPFDGGHNKFLEQIGVWVVVRSPRYWWQEADTFRLSSKSSQSTMHTILKNELTADNFECKDTEGIDLNYLNTLLKEKQLIKLKRKLPEGFMQKRVWFMSYKTLRNIILQRRKHLLPHWQYLISELRLQVKHPELLPTLEG
jgi:hypothetical protein